MKNIVLERKEILRPQESVDWASEMVLNPAIIKDPKTNRIHMLVRTTGPCAGLGLPETPEPFPIFFAYAWSDDNGKNWEFDWDTPALAPAMKQEKAELWIENGKGEKVPNYTNGCIEDPRLFWVEGECYCTAACRMFAPGPYWIHDEPTQCAPEWAKGEENPFMTQKNQTVTVMYKVDLEALAEKDYKNAFKYITNLTSVANGEDRDVFLFPEKMKIKGKDMYVMIHRPHHPDGYEGITETRPSIMLSAAESIYDLADNAAYRMVLYAPTENWQTEKVGGSTPPLPLGNGEWLFNFHGKKDSVVGYAQSFMILKEVDDDFPEIAHICKEPWIVNEADFEKPRRCKTPCVFFTGMIESGSNLLIAYGAADERVGIMTVDYNLLLEELRKCGN